MAAIGGEPGPTIPVRTAQIPAAATSDGPTSGVVWTPPRDPRTGLATLNRMARFGVTAVRLTRPVFDGAFLARADSLGLSLYMDVPVGNAGDAASALRDTVSAVRAAASRHPSIRAIGAAPRVPGRTAVCAALDTLSQQIADGSRLRSYYVTPLGPGSDPCAGDASLLLPDVRHVRNPVGRWEAWREAASVPVGLGALGVWMRPGMGRGLQQPHSPEWQARRLEIQLSRFLDASLPTPPVVFVYHWQDLPASSETPGLPTRSYGLIAPDGSVRPAGRVVRGFYSGRQEVFAFPRGQSPTDGWSGLVVLGWIVLGSIAAVFAQAPLARRTAARYFSAHGFYRDAVREGRETLPRLQPVLLLCVAVSIGIVGAAAARGIDVLPETVGVLERLPERAAAALDLALAHPSWVGLAGGGLGLAVLVGWALVLALAAREWEYLRIDQALMIVTWPCWPVIPLMVAGLVAVSQPPGGATGILLPVCIAAVAVSILIVVRVLRDFAAVTGVPVGIAGLLTLLSPPALAAAAVLLLGWRAGLSFSTLWSLLPHL